MISIGIDACAKETCTVGFCYNDIQTLPSHTIVTSNNGIVPPKASSKTFVSIDLIVKATCTAQPRVPKECWPINPCKNKGRCFSSQPTGYRCQCDKENDGPRCQKTTRYIRYDGYFWLTPLNYFFEGLLSFEFRTMNRDGLLLFHGPLSKCKSCDLHCTKKKFSIKGFFSKCDQIRRKLPIWSHLLKKSLMENLIFCAV